MLGIVTFVVLPVMARPAVAACWCLIASRQWRGVLVKFKPAWGTVAAAVLVHSFPARLGPLGRHQSCTQHTLCAALVHDPGIPNACYLPVKGELIA